MNHRTIIAATLTLAACAGAEQKPANPSGPPPPAPAAGQPVDGGHDPAKAHAAVDRLTFNRSAVHLNLPLYWAMDQNDDGAIEPDETALLLFYPTSDTAKWVDSRAFTPQFED